MIKAVIFDFFGVLYVNAVQLAWRELGGDTLPKDKQQKVIDAWQARWQGTLTPEEIIEITAEVLGITPQVWQSTITRHRDIELDRQLLDYIASLRSKYKTGLLSNVQKLERYTPLDELEKYFDAIATSDKIGFSKPDPRAYYYILKKLGIRADESVFIDDIDRYCDVAQSIGMKTIEYQDFGQMKQELEILLADSNN